MDGSASGYCSKALFGICGVESLSSAAGFLIIPFKHSGYYQYHLCQYEETSPRHFFTLCIYMIHIALTINNNFFPRKYYEICVCNGEAGNFL
jgi:hypothetical protein